MWRTVDAKDLAATLSQSEIDAYRRSFPTGGGDPVTRLLSRTAAMVRGYVASNGKVAMGPAETLPESLINAAMDYAAADVLKRMPTPLNEDRRRARQRAEELFEKVANGDYTPESANADEAAATGGPAIEVIVTGRERVSGAKLEGL